MKIAVNNKLLSSCKVSIFYLVALFIVAGAGWFATGYLGDKARLEIIQFNEFAILTQSSNFANEFEHIAREVRVLSGSPLIAPAFISRSDEDIANANSTLDRHNSGIGSSVSYLMDSNGLTIASSNRNDPDSFVGKSYEFRPYFIQASEDAPGRYFALGVTSLKRGFYASYPVKDSNHHIIGVVVIKKDIDGKDADLSRYPYFFLVDPNGVIFLSSRKEMTFKSLWPISRETRLALLESGQFGQREFDALLPLEVVNDMTIKLDGRNYLASRKAINPEGWSTVIMTSTEKIPLYKLAGVVISMWICTLIAVPMVINYRTSRSAKILRASETRYRELFDNTSSGVAIYEVKDGGKNFILKDFNKAGERIDGARKEDIIGKSIHEVRAGIKELGLLDVFERVWRTGVPEHHAASLRHHQGVASWYDNFVYKLPTGEIVAVYDDITERKLMEEESRQTNAYLENIFDNSPDAIGIVDNYGRFIKWNKMAEKLYGYTFEEMKGKSAYDLYADKDELGRMVTSLRREGSVKKWEMRMPRKDGSIFQFEISIGLLKDSQSKTLGSVCVARDLSGFKLALSALKASHERLYREIFERKQADQTVERLRRKNELILNSAGEGILGLDREGRHTFVNPAATGMLGYMADELIGRKGHDLYHHAREDGGAYPEEDCPIVQAFRYGKFCQVTEEVFWRKDGTVFPVRYSSAPIIEEGEVVGAVVTFRDITVSKRGDKERKKLEEQLFHAQKMESVGRLAGGVAHDFNNMLGVIIGRAEMALGMDLSTDKLQHNLQEILKAGLRSAELTRQLLAFARKQIAVPKILDLNDAISSMLKMLRRLIGEDIDLLWIPELDLWKVKMDPSQVDQILANLAVNSRDAISGVGAITMRTGNVEIDDSIRAETPEFIPGEYVLLTVSDTGAGMSKEVCENIFEPFFTTKEVGKGTGLGLSTVYGIVKQNDGFVYVASEPGKGTTFKIYLPRFEAQTARVLSEEAAGNQPTGTETILLVEDDEAILNLSRMILENLGYTVLVSSVPGHALNVVEDHPGDIHLLITDVVMPGMNGRELAEQLSAIRPNLKRLYMSGYTADLIAHRGILDEGVNFIQKPFGSDELAAKVRQVLDHLG